MFWNAGRRLTATLLVANTLIVAFVVVTPWPIGLSAAIGAAGLWCVWLERHSVAARPPIVRRVSLGSARHAFPGREAPAPAGLKTRLY